MIFLIQQKNQSFLIDSYIKVRIVRTDSPMVLLEKLFTTFLFSMRINKLISIPINIISRDLKKSNAFIGVLQKK